MNKTVKWLMAIAIGSLGGASPWLVHAAPPAQAPLPTQVAPQTHEAAQASIPLTGEIRVKNPEDLRFDKITLSWEWDFIEIEFSNPEFENLEYGWDYWIELEDYGMIGKTTLYVYGAGNYSGVLSTEVEILKDIIEPSNLSLRFEDYETFTYDGTAHTPYLRTYGNVPSYYARLTFSSNDVEAASKQSPDLESKGLILPPDTIFDAPVNPGHYNIWVEFPETDYYLAMPKTKMGEMTIYSVNQAETALLEEIETGLKMDGFKGFQWNTYYEKNNANRYSRYLTFQNGNITGIDLSYMFESTASPTAFPAALLSFNSLKTLSLRNNNISFDTSELYAIANEFPQGASVLGNLTSLDLSYNDITGSLDPFFELCPSLSYLHLSDNRISEVSYPHQPSYDLNLDFSNMKSDYSVDIDFSDLDVRRLIDQLPPLALYAPYSDYASESVMIYLTEAESFENTYNYFGLSMNLYSTSNSCSVYNYNSGVYRGPMENTFCAAGSAWYSGAAGIKFKANVKFRPDDINIDFKNNVADVQAIASYILSPGRYNLFHFTCADRNQDERIDARDLVLYVNTFLASEPQSFHNPEEATLLAMRKNSPYKNEEEIPAQGLIYCENGRLILETTSEVGALDLLIESDDDPFLTSILKDAGFSVTVTSAGRRHRLLAYSMNQAALPPGITVLVENFIGEAIAGSLSSPDATEIPLISRISTDVTEVSVDNTLSAFSENGSIIVNSPTSAMWRMTTISGVILGEGNIEAGTTVLPAGKPDRQPVILIVTTDAGTRTFKL